MCFDYPICYFCFRCRGDEREIKDIELDTHENLCVQLRSFTRKLHPFNKMRADLDYPAYWAFAERACPDLAQVAFAIRAMTMSEACTERSFSHQKIVHEPRRANLGHSQVEAEVYIRMNWEKFTEKNVRKSKKQRVDKN